MAQRGRPRKTTSEKVNAKTELKKEAKQDYTESDIYKTIDLLKRQIDNVAPKHLKSRIKFDNLRKVLSHQR